MYSIDLEYGVGRIRAGQVSIKFRVFEEPLYRVQWQSFEIVMAGECHCVARSHNRWHVDRQILQPRRACNRTIPNDFIYIHTDTHTYVYIKNENKKKMRSNRGTVTRINFITGSVTGTAL